MMPNRYTVPRSLELALREHQVVPFAGAGVSMSIHRYDGRPAFPGWSGLLEHAATRLHEEHSVAEQELRQKIGHGDLVGAGGVARDALGSLWTAFLRTEFEIPRSLIPDDSLSLPRLLWALRPDIVLTTNYDRTLEWACPFAENLQRWMIQAPSGFVAALRGKLRAPALWHIHGHIDHVDDLILTPDGYTKLYSRPGGAAEYEAALSTLRSLITTKTFLFVGFSFRDAALSQQFEWIHDVFAGNAGPHYLLVASAERDEARSRVRGLPIEVLTYEPERFPLEEFLGALSDVARGGPIPWVRSLEASGRTRLRDASQDILFWSTTNGSDRTLRLRPNGDSMEIVGTFDGIVTMAGTNPWEFRRTRRPVGDGAHHIDGSLIDSLEDGAFWSASDGDSIAAASVLPYPGAWGGEYERTLSLVFALGQLVCTAHEDFVEGGAHPNRHWWAQVVDLESRRRSDIFTTAEMSEILRSEREEAFQLFRSGDFGFGDEAPHDLELVLAIPEYAETGALSLRLQFAGPTAYAGSDGQWTSYTRSCFARARTIPLALSPYATLPKQLLTFINGRGFPRQWGWSRVRPTLQNLSWIDTAFRKPA